MEHAPAWLISSLIYLTAAVAAVPLAKALGLGAIIGYLLAGVAIGPWGIGLVRNVQDVLHFSEFGVVLMLFLVGLELEPKRLWNLRRPIFVWGSAQVLVCAAAMAAVAVAFGVTWSVALVAGLGLALSSTAIALQVMAERNILPTSSGQSAFAILLFQDVAAIPILALIPLLGVAQLTQAGASPSSSVVSSSAVWLSAFSVMAVIALIVLGGRLLVRPALRWIAQSRTPEIFTAASLLLVVAIAAAMHSVGLSMALGAFLAGVLLAESEYKHELETDIEPFKGLLLGLFFIAVGMSIDFGVLQRQYLLVGALLVGFLCVKAVVIFALAKAMGIGLADRPVFTLLLAQGGEFAFVVFQAAAGAKLFDAELTSVLIGTVALSMLISPLILVALDRWLLPRFAAPKRDMEEISETQTAPVLIAGFGRYGQIVARLLLANRIPVTVLDFDANRVETARNFGYRVFYGDATRLDLLRIAGAEKAQVVVVALDSTDATNALVDTVKAHFGQAQLVVRVRDLTHAYDLLDRGIHTFDRELFEASLASGARVLQALGHDAKHTAQLVHAFKTHNIAVMHSSHAVRHDNQQLIAVAKQSRADLENQMAQDQENLHEAQQRADAVADAFGLHKT